MKKIKVKSYAIKRSKVKAIKIHFANCICSVLRIISELVYIVTLASYHPHLDNEISHLVTNLKYKKFKKRNKIRESEK